MSGLHLQKSSFSPIVRMAVNIDPVLLAWHVVKASGLVSCGFRNLQKPWLRTTEVHSAIVLEVGSSRSVLLSRNWPPPEELGEPPFPCLFQLLEAATSPGLRPSSEPTAQRFPVVPGEAVIWPFLEAGLPLLPLHKDTRDCVSGPHRSPRLFLAS